VRCAGIKLNLINFIALPLLIGIDVDYGIYLVSLARRSPQIKDSERALSSGALAVMVCASSMVAGYASLVTISIPAVRLLGIVVAVGVAACLAIVYLMLVPLLLSDRAGQQR
jgi:predicted RND superfamily exporter protein